MDLKALETKWRTVLRSILDELTEVEFQKLLFNLEKIPQGSREGRLRGDMPRFIIQYYGTEGSIPLIDRQMRNLPRLDAAVQQPLRDMKDKLKKLREKSKAATSNQTDSGAVTEKKKPAAAATSKQTDSGAVTEKKKPAAAATSKQTNGSGAVTEKKKPAAEVSGETQIMGRGLTLNPAWFLPNPKKVPVRAVEPQQKEPAGDTLKPKAQSAAPLQTRKIKVITLLRTNKTNAHLQVQFEDGLQEVYGKTEVLSEGMGFKSVEEFNKGFFHMLPLTVTAHMQGKRILEMRMI